MVKFKRILYRNKSCYRLAKKIISLFSDKVFNENNDIVVCGMTRSGSTLIYNILKIITCDSSEFCYFYNHKTYKASFDSDNIVKKTHSYMFELERRIIERKTIAYFSYRNLYDVITSTLQRKWKKSVDDIVYGGYLDAIALTSMLYSNISNMNLIKYEDVIRDPEFIIRHIWSSLGVGELDEIKLNDCLRLFNHNGEDESIISEKDKSYDALTGFHKHHVFDPHENKYMSYLTNKDIDKLRKQKSFVRYMEHFKYDL